MGAPLKLTTVIGEDRRLVLELPEDAPTGAVEVEIRSTEPQIDTSAKNAAREVARAKLAAAGALRVLDLVPEGAQALTLEQRMQLGTLPAHARPSEALIDEDRGSY